MNHPEREPNVYVVNRGGHDFSAAERYGRLVYCTDGSMPRYNTNQMFREMSEAMRDSAPTDYLLLTSLTTLNVIAAGIFASKHGRLNLLLYQAGKNRGGPGYIDRTIIFTEMRRVPRDRCTVEEKEPEDQSRGTEETSHEDGTSEGDNGEHRGAGGRENTESER